MFAINIDLREIAPDLQLKFEFLIRDFLHEMADFAEDRFEHHVPRGKSLRTLEAIEQGDVEYDPARGFSVEVGIGPIEPKDQHESEEYPLFVHQGTGMHSDKPHWIEPEHGNVMVFSKLGEGSIFTRNVEGQKPQPYLDDVARETNAEFRLRKRELAAKLNSLM